MGLIRLCLAYMNQEEQRWVNKEIFFVHNPYVKEGADFCMNLILFVCSNSRVKGTFAPLKSSAWLQKIAGGLNRKEERYDSLTILLVNFGLQ